MSRGGPSPIPIGLGEGEKEKLRSGAHSRTLGHGMVQRAQIVLACAEGESQVMIAKRLGVSPVTVGKWRRPYHAQGVAGFTMGSDLDGHTHADEQVAEVTTRHCRVRHPTPAIGAFVPWLSTRVSPGPPCSAGSSCFTCRPMALALQDLHRSLLCG